MTLKCESSEMLDWNRLLNCECFDVMKSPTDDYDLLISFDEPVHRVQQSR